MKTNLLVAAALSGAVLFTGCDYDDDHEVRRVSVSTGGPAYYGDYDEDAPYYSHSGRRYYRSRDRYVYYQDRRPYYVTSVPSRAVYTTPSHHRSTTVSRVVRHHDRHDDDDD